MKKLHIGKDGFTLPLELVTSTQAILARKRSGKSYTASVEAEELLEHKQQVLAIDPTSAWHGLRSSADGTKPGYTIVVFGGDHADAPLDFCAGKAMAAAVVEHGFSAIFDIGNLDTDEQIEFVMSFCRELLRINRTAVHLFMDEADTFAPQVTESRIQKQCLGTVSRLVKQGGIRGVGFTMITQRPADMNKRVLSQVDILTVLRMSHPLDIKAATDWIKSEVGPAFAEEVKNALPALPIGTGFFCSAPLEIGQRVEVRARRTFNSGATPKPGERKVEPKVLAKIDIEKLGKEISASVQRVREESPEFLKKRIAELEKAHTATAGAPPSLKPERERMLLDTINTLETSLAATKRVAGTYEKVMAKIYASADKMIFAGQEIQNAVNEVRQGAADAANAVQSKPQNLTFSGAEFPPSTKPKIAAPPPPRSTGTGSTATVVSEGLTGPEQRVLDAIGFWRVAMPHRVPPLIAIAMIANYTVNGTFNNLKAVLRNKGLVEYQDGSLIFTLAGAVAAKSPELSPTNTDVQALILSRLDGPQQRVLNHLLSKYPKSVRPEELAEASGYTVNGTFNNIKGKLRTLGIIRYESGASVAESWLFPEGV